MMKLHRNQLAKAGTAFLSFVQSNRFLNLLFILSLFSLPVQLGYHVWPSFSFLHGIRSDYLSPTLYFSDILILLFLCAWVIHFSKLFLRWTVFAPRILFLSGILLVGLVLSDAPLRTLYGSFKIVEMVLFACAARLLFEERGIQKSGVSALLVSMCLASLLAISQFIHQGSLNGLFYLLGERTFTSETPGIANAVIDGGLVLRPYSVFPHPNVLAGFLTLLLLCALFIFQASSLKQYQRVIVSCVFAFGLLALLLTLSRVAIVVFLIAGSVLLIRQSKSATLKKRLLLTLLGCVAIGILVLTPLIGQRLIATSITEQAVTERVEQVSDAVGIVTTRPVFGTGLLGYLPSLVKTQDTGDTSTQPVHSVHILIAVETGIVGLSVWLYFLFLTYRKIFQIKQAESFNFFFLKQILFLVFLLLSSTDHYFYTLQQGQMMTAILFAFLWTDSKSYKGQYTAYS